MNLGRIIVPVITPFKGDTSIDYKKFSNLLKETWREDFTDSIIIMATTGEFASMTFEERKSLIKCAREAVSNKPLIVGTSAVTTAETVKLTKAAEEIGADVALVMQPYYYRPSQEETYEHFKTIAESTNIPIMIYQSKSGGTFSQFHLLLEKLEQHGNPIYTKFLPYIFSLFYS